MVRAGFIGVMVPGFAMFTGPFQRPAGWEGWQVGWQRRTPEQDMQCRHPLVSQTLPSVADGQRGPESHDKCTAVLVSTCLPPLSPIPRLPIAGVFFLRSILEECSPGCPCHKGPRFFPPEPSGWDTASPALATGSGLQPEHPKHPQRPPFPTP